MEKITFLKEIFISIPALVAAVLFVIDWLKNIFKIEKRWLIQLLSWLLSLTLACLGLVLSSGLFAEFVLLPAWQGWLYTGVVGIVVALIANGLSTYEAMKSILKAVRTVFEFLLSLFSKKK